MGIFKRSSERQKPRYKCNKCNSFQADGAWEKVMEAEAKARGKKGFFNIYASPQSIN